MVERNNQQESFDTDPSLKNADNGTTGRGKGKQGVDKAPGEEPSADPEQFVEITQKGKKVDADPSKPSGQPVNEDI